MFKLSDAVKKRYAAFWEVDAFERCCLFISLQPDETMPPPPDAPKDVAMRWEDADFRTHYNAWYVENTRFFADGFPYSFVNFGPGCLAAMIGGDYQPAEDTVWFENEQVITDWSCPPPPAIDQNSAMFNFVETLTRSLIDNGQSCVSITDIGGTYDIIASLRGTQNLLIDLYEHSEEIKAYVTKLQTVWRDYYIKSANRLIEAQGGMTSWMPVWSDKAYYPLQCDFSAMISPDMFADFIVPDLQHQTGYMKRSIYHLDGPGEIPHLRHILSISHLTAVQWVPGAGNPDTGEECWYDMYREIQAAGKGLVLLDLQPETLENLLNSISSKGLFVSCNVQDDKQAMELIRMSDSFGVK